MPYPTCGCDCINCSLEWTLKECGLINGKLEPERLKLINQIGYVEEWQQLQKSRKAEFIAINKELKG